MTMIDNPVKAMALFQQMKDALPFEADMTPELAATLTTKHGLKSKNLRQTVTDVFYAGDIGGITCRIGSDDEANTFIVSLTHLRIPRALPFAVAAIDYQRHRVKKIKKQR
ncbi:MAG: hypothetical protein ACKVP5_08875 [Aestuariivirga sp.]